MTLTRSNKRLQIVKRRLLVGSAVGLAKLAMTGDHVSGLAIFAQTAPGNMVKNHPVTDLEFPAVRPDFEDLAARLMASDRSGLISLGAFSQVGSVNSAYIAATDRAGFHLDKDLAMPRPFYADHGRMQAVSVRNLLDDRIHDIDGVGRSAVTVRAAG